MKYSKEERRRNHRSDHIFGIIKARFRYRKTRYKGIKKQEAKLNTLCSLANLVIAQGQNLSI